MHKFKNKGEIPTTKLFKMKQITNIQSKIYQKRLRILNVLMKQEIYISSLDTKKKYNI